MCMNYVDYVNGNVNSNCVKHPLHGPKCFEKLQKNKLFKIFSELYLVKKIINFILSVYSVALSFIKNRT